MTPKLIQDHRITAKEAFEIYKAATPKIVKKRFAPNEGPPDDWLKVHVGKAYPHLLEQRSLWLNKRSIRKDFTCVVLGKDQRYPDYDPLWVYLIKRTSRRRKNRTSMEDAIMKFAEVWKLPPAVPAPMVEPYDLSHAGASEDWAIGFSVHSLEDAWNALIWEAFVGAGRRQHNV